jgi:predicted metal-dependent hydrolase
MSSFEYRLQVEACQKSFRPSTLSAWSRYAPSVSRKSAIIAALIEECQGHALDAHYLGYFKCFNRQLFYEAHDVLEELWLGDRKGPNDAFYKGLIQLAGAFVHLQKNRLRPSAALLKLARANLEKYPAVHQHLNIAQVLIVIQVWLEQIESHGFAVNPLTSTNTPRIHWLSPMESPGF